MTSGEESWQHLSVKALRQLIRAGYAWAGQVLRGIADHYLPEETEDTTGPEQASSPSKNSNN